jgi:hypothetical protein
LVSDTIVGHGKTTRKRGRHKYPKAFWIVPVKLKSRVRRHAHVLGQAAIPPCPIGTVFAGRISVGPVSFCVYVDKGGAELLIQC